MCRSIKTLRTQDSVTEDEVAAAALQFVRKISGYRQPSRANREVFERAVEEVARSTERLLADLEPPPAAGRRAPTATRAPEG